MNTALHYAVVVGIKHYPGISNLNLAVKDAQSFRDWLLKEGGVPPENIRTVWVEDEPPKWNGVHDAEPTRDKVNRALREVNESVEKKVAGNLSKWEETRLYFYVSGHGIAPAGGESALLMANASEGYWSENVACRRYLDRYQECQYFREVLVFSDCCRNTRPAELGGPPFSSKNNRGQVKTFLGFATLYDEAAFEPVGSADADDARSHFTQALLEGLRGEALDKNTGNVTTRSIAQYVRERVKDLTKEKRYPQLPEFLSDLNDPIILRHGAAPKSHDVTLHFPAGYTGDVELYHGSGALRGSWNAGNGSWVIALPDGLYEVRAKDGHVFLGDGLFKVIGGNRNVQL